MAHDIKQVLVTGLTSSPKYIPHWYIYDDVGSTIQYRTVTEPPEYYLNTSERSILEENIQDIIPSKKNDLTLVDLGSGNCSKTKLLIDELLKRQNTLTFYPVDISKDFLMKSVKTLSEEYGDSLVLRPIAADYVEGIQQLKVKKGNKIIVWLGGGIINLPYDDQVNTLRRISTMMTDECRLVFSADITQDRTIIIKAYKDDAGLIQAFNQHAIERLNQEEGSVVDLSKFTYDIDFISDNNPQYMSYTRAYIEAKETVLYPIPGLGIHLQMDKGERLYFHKGDGFSCKYTMEQLQNIVEKAGLRLADTWIDVNKHVAVCQCVLV